MGTRVPKKYLQEVRQRIEGELKKNTYWNQQTIYNQQRGLDQWKPPQK